MERSTAHAADTGPLPIGTRIRRIRLKQGKTLKAVAELAGITASHLSRLENGKRPLDSRKLADGIAAALGVPLSSLLEEPSAGSDAALAAAALRFALAGVSLTDAPDSDPPPWAAVLADGAALEALRPRADYVGVALQLPGQLAGLHAHIAGPRRRDALIGMTDCYLAAQATARNVGAHDLALLAGHHVETVTSALDGPEWGGLAIWSRVLGLGPIARSRARAVAETGIDQLDDHLDDPRVAEVVGMLHLSAAHASAVTDRTREAEAHLAEAGQLAGRPGVGGFAHLGFGPWNVGAWSTAIAVELGEGGRAMDIAQTLDDTSGPPSQSRRAAWLIDLGRGAAMSSRTRRLAKRAFLEAEEVAPQRLRANPWAQEVVTDLRNRARARDWELENLAERMGVASWLGSFLRLTSRFD